MKWKMFLHVQAQPQPAIYLKPGDIVKSRIATPGRRDRPRGAAQSHRQRGGLNASGFRGERRPPNRARGEPDTPFGLSQVRDGEHLASVGTGLRDRLPRWPAETITIQWICENLAINQMGSGLFALPVGIA